MEGMKEMIQEVVKACLLIFLAELGDKTQILAMAFALQFSVRQVLFGVGLGAFLNHGLAVLVGAYLAHVIPLETIRFGSALLFLGFGFWSLMDEDGLDHGGTKSSGNPILVVALAFFLGELGDKTQLTAIALASSAQFPWAVLAGTVLGMVLTSFMGIVVGRKLGERIPEFTLKLISGGVFIGFGVLYLAQTVPARFLTTQNVVLFLVTLIALILSIIIPPLRRRASGSSAPGQLKQVASTLHALDRALQDICLGEEHCRGRNCPVGYCQSLVRQALNGAENSPHGRLKVLQPYVKKEQVFDRKKVKRALALLEQGDLDSVIYGELKANLEKLLSSRQ